MSILRQLGNVVSGRYRHWNENNNQNIMALLSQTKNLQAELKIIYEELIISTLSLSDLLLNPDNKDKLISVDALDLNKNQYLQIHAALLQGMAGTFAKLNPTASESILGTLKALLDGYSPNSEVLEELDSREEVDVGTLGSVIWSHLIEITQSTQGTTMIDAYPFIAAFGAGTSSAFKDIREKLKTLKAEDT